MKFIKSGIIGISLLMLFGFTKTENRLIADQKKASPFTFVIRHTQETSSQSESVYVYLTINTGTDAITLLGANRASDCGVYEATVSSGYVDHTGSDYYAHSLVIDMGTNGTVTLNGLLDLNLGPCHED
jgi:hypothetical protein